MSHNTHSFASQSRISIVVCALGYFVDVFDIVLFLMVRSASLSALGYSGAALLEVGAQLYNIQLAGMLLGGILWGIVGDKVGRIEVLFGTILLYSLANIANAYVGSVEAYAACRFAAGLGLAGEVGAAVTLVAELMKRENRGLGTTVIATSGTCGAITASLTGQLVGWQASYILGGLLGILLLGLRFGVRESGIFVALRDKRDVPRGDLRLIFQSPERRFAYFACILSGTPLFFTLYVMLAFAPELGEALRIDPPIVTAKASFYFTAAMALGDLSCGALSQYLRSRKRALYSFITAAFFFTAVLLNIQGISAQTFYLLCLPTGFFIGYWAVYVSTVVEQFGTNLRSTATTSILNLVRATSIIMNYLFLFLKDLLGSVESMRVVGILAFVCSLYFLSTLKESFHDDLQFIESEK